MPDDRILHLCDVCFAVDSDPRHVQYVAEGGVPTDEQLTALEGRTDIPLRVFREMMDPQTIIRHMNCCADSGCAVCAQTVALTNGVTGAALIAALATGVNDHLTTDADTVVEA